MINHDLLTAIALLFVMGILLIYWSKKRRFDRRNALGIEQFGSLFEKIIGVLFDAILWWSGVTILFSGLFAIIVLDQTILSWVALLILISLSNLLFPDGKHRHDNDRCY